MIWKDKENSYLTPSQPLPQKVLYDKFLLFVVFLIIAFGLMMVASASIVISDKQYAWPFHYLFRQVLYLIFAFALSAGIFFVNTRVIRRVGLKLLLIAFVCLFLVLVPGIGRHVNGSARWIGLGPIGMQVSEFAKLAVVVYLADYLIRYNQALRTQISGFLKPMAFIGMMGLLLLAEPDFGAFVVIMMTALTMMFLSGVRLKYFLALVCVVLVLFAIIAISSPYRLERLVTFINPWAHQYQAGYQLTQSLIAFGRGGWSGVGLGDSIQKLFYLPEAHTDFLFAVIAEELGLIGVLTVILLYTLLIGRMLVIAWRARSCDNTYGALLVFGFAFWLAMQFIVNVGVNAGVLPTKGLTLPFMSYGGSSLLIDCIVIAMTLRVDYERRLAQLGIREISDLPPEQNPYVQY